MVSMVKISREDTSARTYAALAGDGLMPEIMPPLAPDELRKKAPSEGEH
jgi:hypothetical protein